MTGDACDPSPPAPSCEDFAICVAPEGADAPPPPLDGGAVGACVMAPHPTTCR
jgi:hypothetical protein